MENQGIARGTLQITLTSGIEYFVLGLFYIAVTKSGAMTQADIGALSILTLVSSIIHFSTGLALPTALTKFASESIGKNDIEKVSAIRKTVFRTVVVLSLIIIPVLALFSQQISYQLFGSSTYAGLILLVLVQTFSYNIIVMSNSTLQAFYLFGRIAIINLTMILVGRITAFLLALLNLGLNGVIFGLTVGSVTAMTLSLIFLRGKIPKTTDAASLKPMLKFSFPLLLSSVVLLVLNWADIVIITAVTSDYSITGLYYIALRSVAVLTILYLPISTTIFPALSARNGQGKTDDMTNILRIASRYLIYVIVPSCLGLATISSTALSFFYGESYIAGAIPMAVLALSTIVASFYNLYLVTMQSMGRTTKIFQIQTISATLTLITLAATVPFLQATGAALAKLITNIVGLGLIVYFLQKNMRVRVDREALTKSILSSIFFIPFIVVIENGFVLQLSILERLIIEVVGALSIYMLSMYLLKALKKEDFDLLEQALPKMLLKYLKIFERIMI